MTPRAYHEYLCRLAVEAGADPERARERMAQAATVATLGNVHDHGCRCPDCEPGQEDGERDEGALMACDAARVYGVRGVL